MLFLSRNQRFGVSRTPESDLTSSVEFLVMLKAQVAICFFWAVVDDLVTGMKFLVNFKLEVAFFFSQGSI